MRFLSTYCFVFLICVIFSAFLVPSYGTTGIDKAELSASLKSSETLRRAKRELNFIPQQRSVSKIILCPKKNYDAYGYSLLVPLAEDQRIIRNNKITTIVSINNFLISIEPRQEMDWTLRRDDIISQIGFEEYLPPPEILSSDYKLISCSLNQTYDDFINDVYIDSVAQAYFYLSIKFLYVSGTSERTLNPPPIYSFEVNDFKGYQIGDLNRTNIIDVYLFEKSRMQLKLKIIKSDDSKFNQDHIDFILNNIKRKNST